VHVSWVLPAPCNALPPSQPLAAKLSGQSLGKVQGMACPGAEMVSLACAVKLVWAAWLGQDGFSTGFVLFPGSERKPRVGWAGCTPPPAASSIPEGAFSACAPALSVDEQWKGHRWDSTPG